MHVFDFDESDRKKCLDLARNPSWDKVTGFGDGDVWDQFYGPITDHLMRALPEPLNKFEFGGRPNQSGRWLMLWYDELKCIHFEVETDKWHSNGYVTIGFHIELNHELAKRIKSSWLGRVDMTDEGRRNWLDSRRIEISWVGRTDAKRVAVEIEKMIRTWVPRVNEALRGGPPAPGLRRPAAAKQSISSVTAAKIAPAPRKMELAVTAAMTTNAVGRPDLSKVFTSDEVTRLRRAGFELQPEADAERWDALDRAYQASGLWKGERFACDSFERCQEAFCTLNSHAGIQDNARGTVGDYLAAYNLSFHGRPVRICFVSRDCGHPYKALGLGPHTAEAAPFLLRERITTKHWRNTLQLARYIFLGDWDSDVNRDMLPRKLFAHVRAIKCTGGTTWTPPETMYAQCLRNLKAEVSALQPTLIITQGISANPRAWSSSRAAFTALDEISIGAATDVYSMLVTGSPSERLLTARCYPTEWGSTVVLATYHPCEKQGRYGRCLENELKPAIDTLRQHGFQL